jgi:hypothetical protein
MPSSDSLNDISVVVAKRVANELFTEMMAVQDEFTYLVLHRLKKAKKKTKI